MHRNRISIALFFGLLLGLVALVGTGCATRVSPPQQVGDPVAVYIVDYGRHSSLLLPVDDAVPGSVERTTMREYTYGDWVYYANTDQTNWNGTKALLWKTRGTLGRRDLPEMGPASDEAPIELEARLQRQLAVEWVHAIVVEREAANKLLAALDARFEAGGTNGEGTQNPQFGLDFVPDEAEYSVMHQCNHEVRDWLNELGAEAYSTPLISEYKIVDEPKE